MNNYKELYEETINVMLNVLENTDVITFVERYILSEHFLLILSNIYNDDLHVDTNLKRSNYGTDYPERLYVHINTITKLIVIEYDDYELPYLNVYNIDEEGERSKETQSVYFNEDFLNSFLTALIGGKVNPDFIKMYDSNNTFLTQEISNLIYLHINSKKHAQKYYSEHSEELKILNSEMSEFSI